VTTKQALTRESPSRWRINLIGASASLVFAALAVASVATVSPGYFHVDDALNDILPSSASIWRLLSEGTPPILNASTINGGNSLVDIARAPFHPITVLASAMWPVAGLEGVTFATAFLLLASMFGGAFFLARGGLRLGLGYSLAAGFLTATSPIFVSIYLPSWWAVALGMVGYIWATSALLWAAHSPRPARLLLLGISTWALFATGWPQSYATFAASAILIAAYSMLTSESLGWRRLHTPMKLAAVVVAGSLAGWPIISEYLELSSKGFLDRITGFNNDGNFFTPSVGQLLSVANPVSSDFLSTYWGYLWTAVPFGFATLLLLVAVFFTEHTMATFRHDRLLQLLAANAGLFYLMTQLPAQLGPTRVTFRYLPYALIFVIVGCLHYLNHAKRVWNWSRFSAAVAVIAAGALTASWRVAQPSDLRHSVLTPTLYLVTTSILLLLYRKEALRHWIEGALVIAGALLLAVQIPLSNPFFGGSTQAPQLSAAAQARDLAEGGFLLDAATTGTTPNAVAPGYGSSRYLIAGIRIVNGYDSVGQSAFSRMLPTDSTQWYLGPDAIKTLAGKAPAPMGNTTWFDVMRISAVLTNADPIAGAHDALVGAGFTKVSTVGATAVFTHTRNAGSQTSTVSASTTGTTIGSGQAISDLTEQVEVTNSTPETGEVSFARMYWPGYTATLDGKPLEVRSLNGVLVSVAVPPRTSGTLQLSYWPPSWRTALPIAGFGLLALIVLPFLLGRRSRRSGVTDIGDSDAGKPDLGVEGHSGK
jgi:hypothetical protein